MLRRTSRWNVTLEPMSSMFDTTISHQGSGGKWRYSTLCFGEDYVLYCKSEMNLYGQYDMVYFDIRTYKLNA